MAWEEVEVEELLKEKGSDLECRAPWCASFEPPVQVLQSSWLGLAACGVSEVFSSAQASVWRVVC